MQGHPCGTVIPHGAGYKGTVCDMAGAKVASRVFSVTSVGAAANDRARERAEKWLQRESDQRGYTQNRCQLQKDGHTVTMELCRTGRRAVFDLQDLHRITNNYEWHLVKIPHKVSRRVVEYAIAAHHTPPLYMHALLCPHITRVWHLNEDGLDNRRCNMVNAHRVVRGKRVRSPPTRSIYSTSVSENARVSENAKRRRVLTTTKIQYS